MTRVLLLKGISQYDVLRCFVDYMAEAFQSLGCACRVIDIHPNNPAGVDALRDAIEGFRPDLAFAFNGQGAGISTPEGRLFFEQAIPFYAFMVDDPVFHVFRFQEMQSPLVSLGWADLRFTTYALRLGLERSEFLPLAGRPLHGADLRDRPLDVLLPGTLTDPEEIRATWRTKFSPGISQIMENVAEIWEQDLFEPLHLVFRRTVGTLDLALSPEEWRLLEYAILPEINLFVRNRLRLAVIRALKGFPVTIYGNGPWQALIGEGRFDVRPAVPFPEAEAEIARSKVLLNVSPSLVDGVSERVFCAFLNGAALVTNENRFLDCSFERNKEFLGFRFQDLDDMRAKVDYILSNRAVREEMTERAQAAALQGHTWEYRARHILEQMGMAPAACAERGGGDGA